MPAHRTHVPAPALARLNAAGFCRTCLTRGCTNPVCITEWACFCWSICDVCQGAGLADYAERVAIGDTGSACEPCDCTEGVYQSGTLAVTAGR